MDDKLPDNDGKSGLDNSLIIFLMRMMHDGHAASQVFQVA